MQVLKTTSPSTPPSPSSAPKSTPSNTAPDSSASRPATGATGLAGCAGCDSGTGDLQVLAGMQGRLVDVGDAPARQGEQHPTAQPGAQQRRVARARAHRLGADHPLLVGGEEDEVGQRALAQPRAPRPPPHA